MCVVLSYTILKFDGTNFKKRMSDGSVYILKYMYRVFVAEDSKPNVGLAGFGHFVREQQQSLLCNKQARLRESLFFFLFHMAKSS